VVVVRIQGLPSTCSRLLAFPVVSGFLESEIAEPEQMTGCGTHLRWFSKHMVLSEAVKKRTRVGE
jgi:hypothetical protein